MQNLIELLRRRIWLGPVIGLIIGILLGLLIGWVVVPVNWAPGSDDIASMGDAYEINPTAATALARAPPSLWNFPCGPKRRGTIPACTPRGPHRSRRDRRAASCASESR